MKRDGESIAILFHVVKEHRPFDKPIAMTQLIYEGNDPDIVVLKISEQNEFSELLKILKKDDKNSRHFRAKLRNYPGASIEHQEYTLIGLSEPERMVCLEDCPTSIKSKSIRKFRLINNSKGKKKVEWL